VPEAADSAAFDHAGNTRARQGIAVADMLAGWRLGLDSLYRLASDTTTDWPDRDTLLLEFLELTMAWVDFGMLAAAEGHRRTEITLARERHHAQANLLRRVMAGAVAPAELRTTIPKLGLDPEALYHAVHARPDPATDIGTIEAYLGVGQDTTRGRGLVALIDGDVFGVTTVLPGGPAPTAIGTGGPAPLHDMAEAFRRGRRALDTALALGAKGIFDLDTLGLEAAIVADPDVGLVMAARYLAPLHEAGADPILLTTERYLANNLSAELTAQDLDVHVNTVRQRLSRFEALTGRSLRDTETAFEVWWALASSRLGPASD
jgi:hypothetical protein